MTIFVYRVCPANLAHSNRCYSNLQALKKTIGTRHTDLRRALLDELLIEGRYQLSDSYNEFTLRWLLHHSELLCSRKGNWSIAGAKVCHYVCIFLRRLILLSFASKKKASRVLPILYTVIPETSSRPERRHTRSQTYPIAIVAHTPYKHLIVAHRTH